MVSQTTTAITTPMIVKFTTSIRVAHAGFCIGFSPFAYRDPRSGLCATCHRVPVVGRVEPAARTQLEPALLVESRSIGAQSTWKAVTPLSRIASIA